MNWRENLDVSGVDDLFVIVGANVLVTFVFSFNCMTSSLLSAALYRTKH